MLGGKKILLGVCGSIAAYKSALLTRLLIKEGADVKVIMTSSATHFITPLTLSTLSKNPAYTTYFNSETGAWNNHVEFGLWADLMLIAPASANTIAKLANGLCDNLLTATYLSARCPVAIAPAMDLDMYKHSSTLANIEKLKAFGNTIIDAEHGELASGLVGEGRMAEPEHILEFVKKKFSNSPLKGKKVLVTAGPTYEAIDPVRFIGNYSSGKMGFAIAEVIADNGASVTLISGPTPLQLDRSNVSVKKVNDAAQMLRECESVYGNTDITILSAAVADYKPIHVAPQKIKKKKDNFTLELEKTADIAASLSKLKKEDQITVGFALETENELDNAFKKLKEKKFDLIVLNSLNDAGAGFGHDTNKIKIIDADKKVKDFEVKTKREVAIDIVDAIIKRINA